MRKAGLGAVLAFCAGMGVAGEAAAQADVDRFFAGRRMDVIVGSDAGGGYDLYARLLVRHMGKYLPGSPTFVVQNMPGAGSNKAAEFLYNAAPKDGSTFAILFPGAIMSPLVEAGRGLQFDPGKFNYLGTMAKGSRVCALRKDAPAKTFEEALKNEVVVGASADGGSTVDYPQLSNTILGGKFKIIKGYPGSAQIALAVDRNEVSGICGYDWSSLKGSKPDWLRDGKVNVLIQFGISSEPELDKMGVPTVWSMIKNESDRQIFQLLIGQQEFGRPFVAPPGVPAPILAALRGAFGKALADPALLGEAERQKLEIGYASGEDVQKLVTNLYATPKPVVDKMIQALK